MPSERSRNGEYVIVLARTAWKARDVDGGSAGTGVARSGTRLADDDGAWGAGMIAVE